MTLDEIEAVMAQVFRSGVKPDRILVGKTQLRGLVPYWAATKSDAVRRLYNAGFRGEALSLTRDEAWRLK